MHIGGVGFLFVVAFSARWRTSIDDTRFHRRLLVTCNTPMVF